MILFCLLFFTAVLPKTEVERSNPSIAMKACFQELLKDTFLNKINWKLICFELKINLVKLNES